jgi:hypothetical protein
MSMALAGFAAASASALLATTPACELLREDEASAAIGEAMTSLGGTADDALLSDCTWQGADRARLMFSLADGDLFAPSGRTAIDAIEATRQNHLRAALSYEDIPGLGKRAAISDAPGFLVVYVVAGDDYLTIALTNGSRAAAIAVAERAVSRMSPAQGQ